MTPRLVAYVHEGVLLLLIVPPGLSSGNRCHFWGRNPTILFAHTPRQVRAKGRPSCRYGD